MIEIKEPLNSYKEYPGPILLLAGPGTGKTFQLTKRVKFLLEVVKANPQEITIITFTNEASKNMRVRLTKDDIDLPRKQHPSIIATMHSLGNTIIGTNPELVKLPKEYRVLHEQSPREVLLKDAAFLAGFQRKEWSSAHNCRIKGVCKLDASQDKCKICINYQDLLRKCSLVDYDDQIFLACELLKNHKSVRKYWQKYTK